MQIIATDDHYWLRSSTYAVEDVSKLPKSSIICASFLKQTSQSFKRYTVVNLQIQKTLFQQQQSSSLPLLPQIVQGARYASGIIAFFEGEQLTCKQSAQFKYPYRFFFFFVINLFIYFSFFLFSELLWNLIVEHSGRQKLTFDVITI